MKYSNIFKVFFTLESCTDREAVSARMSHHQLYIQEFSYQCISGHLLQHHLVVLSYKIHVLFSPQHRLVPSQLTQIQTIQFSSTGKLSRNNEVNIIYPQQILPFVSLMKWGLFERNQRKDKFCDFKKSQKKEINVKHQTPSSTKK